MRALLFFGCLCLAACAAPLTTGPRVPDAAIAAEALLQQQLALELKMAERVRLDDAALRLLVAGAEFCGPRIQPVLGLRVHHLYTYPPEYRPAARAAFGVGEALTISHVPAGSPAAQAGVLAGEQVLAVNGTTVSIGPGADALFQEILAQALARGGAVGLTLGGHETVRELHLRPVSQCDYGLRVVDDDTINAMADGNRILVTAGMMRFARDDGELALVIGHEIAHNAMGHVQKKAQNAVVGSIVDVLAGAYGVNTGGAFGNLAGQRYSQEFEKEADYIGLYIMARAGWPVAEAARFWRRMAAENPRAIERSMLGSHPATPERFVALAAAASEIQAKQAQGQPLVPDLVPPPAR